MVNTKVPSETLSENPLCALAMDILEDALPDVAMCTESESVTGTQEALVLRGHTDTSRCLLLGLPKWERQC